MSVILAEHAPVYEGCRFCLMCRHVCPVGRTTKYESNTPHGWALLISSVDRGQMSWDADAVDTLYQCAQCSLCLSNCVTDRPLPSAIAAARAVVVSIGAAPAEVAQVEARLRRWGNPYREEAPAAVVGTAPAALYVGAEAVYLHPQSVAAIQQLLHALGIGHVRVCAGLSSVYLPHALGLRETARILAQSALHDIAASGCSRLIALAPRDLHAFEHIHPELGMPLPDGVELVDMMAVLADGLNTGRLAARPAELSLTYHDPALSPLFPSRAALARRVLAAVTTLPVREMFWREGRAAPGGAVGGLDFTHPALAAQMTRDRLAEAAATGAQTLVTEDPAALAHFAAHADGMMRVQGLYELLAELVDHG
jgi:Fe-S oxidoreductase